MWLFMMQAVLFALQGGLCKFPLSGAGKTGLFPAGAVGFLASGPPSWGMQSGM